MDGELQANHLGFCLYQTCLDLNLFKQIFLDIFLCGEGLFGGCWRKR